MRRVLLDANILIHSLGNDRSTTDEQYHEAKQLLEELLEDDSVSLITTPLIRHEIMRGLNRSDLSKNERVKAVLDYFTSVDITDEISEIATELYQIIKGNDVSEGVVNRNARKLGFDLMHVATAHRYDLEIMSFDSDIDRLRKIACTIDLISDPRYPEN